MQKRQLGPCVTFFPQPATLIASRDDNARTNLMMASWVGIVSKTPPTVAVALNRDRQTYANIMATRQFSVNVVPADKAVEGDFCGLASGKEYDKLPISDLSVETGSGCGAPVVVEAPLNLECRYREELAIGDYLLVLGEIVEVHACEAAFDGEGKMDVRAFDPLVYLGGIREYWNLGAKVADAYRAGLQKMPEK